MLGLNDIIGKDDSCLFQGDHLEVFWSEDRKVFSGEESTNHEYIGDSVYVVTRKFPLKLPDGTVGLVGIIINAETGNDEPGMPGVPNVTDSLSRLLEVANSERETALEMARTDPTTELLNRRGFVSEVNELIELAKEDGRSFSLVLIDLDNFKRINDQFGHNTGDYVLTTFAKRLRDLPGCSGFSRLGGDEFGLLVATDNLDQFTMSGQTESTGLVMRLFQPVDEVERRIIISGSIGISNFPRNGKTHSELLRSADLALYEAKRCGKARSQRYNKTIHKAALRRRKIELALPTAIASGKIYPVFQPIISSHSLAPVGVEVLVRWRNDEIGPMEPMRLIEIATEIGKMSQLDDDLLEVASRPIKSWIAEGLIKRVSFNVSPNDIVTDGYASRKLKQFEDCGLAASHVCLEVVEHNIVHDFSRAKRNMDELREAGTTFALDDYGNGYSNWRSLIDLPFSSVKIDRSLIASINTSNRARKILDLVTQLTPAIGMSIVAEGAESKEEIEYLRNIGCHFLQGFAVSKPLVEPRADSWLRAAPSRD